jgi:hypothetical protein
MIALLCIYFVGKAFYDLAIRHKKSKWGFAILGVVSFYAGLFIGGVLIVVAYTLISPGAIDDVNDKVLDAMGVPVGILACWGFYKWLESRWNRSPKSFHPEDILDADLPGDQAPE